ncbi:MAG TPA: metal-sulfur cluster assembly factor [Acidimicrobiia bacterium]|jgi:metal-sulfur cluster biosynthetic enzyme|nr:metal-sulfur cluster assembly factor [Acidimicrobiia bacterium]
MTARTPGLEYVWEALDEILDPELGVAITDLGLVYGVHDEGDRLRIVITTTTPICPLGSYIRQQIERRLIDHVVEVEIVHDPLWDPTMMNDRARRQLGWVAAPQRRGSVSLPQ